ncbi:sugar transferase [Hominenteromicrobium sp.]|jgi:sugar transferases involved in lipopolysaccharide synthesis|uniref:sugar transferase n=1 Tax=Hominenteromicrobium sp. TaxID=3073581 RepID=UPI00399309CD
MISWEKLPPQMQTEAVKPYYEILQKKQIGLIFKRLFDIVVSLIMLLILSPVFLILAIAIKLDTEGPVFYRQVRVTQYGKEFHIFKFRTMVNNADKIGSQVTVGGDSRITRVGKVIRECRLDEIGQLLNILGGSMTFVGTRPEVPKYVEKYTPEMWATLLLPAGVTSEASIRYKDEAALLDAAEDVDTTYIQDVLPGKMKYNLRSIQEYSFFKDIETMFQTVFAVVEKNS